jgi:hypothetical protein
MYIVRVNFNCPKSYILWKNEWGINYVNFCLMILLKTCSTSINIYWDIFEIHAEMYIEVFV